MKTGFYCIAIILGICTRALGADLTDSSQMTRSPSLSIDPKHRAQDYLQIFETLRKEKPSNKVCIFLTDGTKIINIIDMRLMSSNTVFLLRYNTPQGIKLQPIELERIQHIGCLE